MLVFFSRGGEGDLRNTTDQWGKGVKIRNGARPEEARLVDMMDTHTLSYNRTQNEHVANFFNLLTALPVLLAHSNIIEVPAMVMCIIGGLLIYGTIISFGMSFQEDQEF